MKLLVMFIRYEAGHPSDVHGADVTIGTHLNEASPDKIWAQDLR